MKLPGSRAHHEQAPPRSMVASVAQLLLGACAVVIVWEVLVRLTTTTRAPTHISVQWNRCEDGEQPAGNSTDTPVGAVVLRNAAFEDVTAPDTSTPGQGSVSATKGWVGRPVKSVAEKRRCIRDTFAGGTVASESKVFSQMNEDGVIQAIWGCLTPQTKDYVEFGVEDGTECTTKNLRENEGWTGLLMDGSHENPLISLKREFFTAENIAGLFEKYSVPRNFDHFTIDIDQNTFWVLHSVLLAGFRPRCIVVEINRNFHLMDSFVVPYDDSRMWDGTIVFGASVGALDKLLSAFSYQVIAVDQDQINLYAVDSAEIGAERVISDDEVAAGVQLPHFMCAQIHACPEVPTVLMQVPENVSLARPREEWYTSLPLWSLACATADATVLFTGVQMEAPVNVTEQDILTLAPTPVDKVPQELVGSTPCGTIDSINSAVAAALEQQVVSQPPVVPGR